MYVTKILYKFHDCNVMQPITNRNVYFYIYSVWCAGSNQLYLLLCTWWL